MIPMALIGICLCGLWLSTFPSYPVFLLIYCLLAVFADMFYWPTMLKRSVFWAIQKNKAVCSASWKPRGLMDTIVAFCALGIFLLLAARHSVCGVPFYSMQSCPVSSASSCSSYWIPIVNSLLQKNRNLLVHIKRPGLAPSRLLKTKNLARLL